MYRLIISIALVLMVVHGGHAQVPVDFSTINRETYRLYLAGEWDSVIVVGKTALKQEIDYYYLRMRMGIAFHEKKNFRRAAIHFKKALVFNPDDPLALEYLYYAILFSGEHDQASLVRKKFKGDLALKLAPSKGKFLDQAGGVYLYSQGLHSDLLADPDGLFQDLPPGIQYITRHYSNASLSLSNIVTPGFRLNHTYTFLSKNNHQYYNDGQVIFQLTDQHVYQHMYHLSPVITTPSGYEFTPMLHLLSIYYQAVVNVEQGFQGGGSRAVVGYLDAFDFVSGLGFRKGFGTIDLHLGAWYASLNNNEQIQNRLGVTWYPKGNLNLYTGGYLNSQYEISAKEAVIRIIPELHVGVAIAGKVWVDLNGAFGEMTNYLEHNGSAVFNSFSEVMHKKVSMTLSLPLTDKGSLIYLGGRWTSNESRFYPFDPTQNDATNNIGYNALSIYGGITWKF